MVCAFAGGPASIVMKSMAIPADSPGNWGMVRFR